MGHLIWCFASNEFFSVSLSLPLSPLPLPPLPPLSLSTKSCHRWACVCWSHLPYANNYVCCSLWQSHSVWITLLHQHSASFHSMTTNNAAQTLSHTHTHVSDSVFLFLCIFSNSDIGERTILSSLCSISTRSHTAHFHSEDDDENQSEWKHK